MFPSHRLYLYYFDSPVPMGSMYNVVNEYALSLVFSSHPHTRTFQALAEKTTAIIVSSEMVSLFSFLSNSHFYSFNRSPDSFSLCSGHFFLFCIFQNASSINNSHSAKSLRRLNRSRPLLLMPYSTLSSRWSGLSSSSSSSSAGTLSMYMRL